MNDHLDLFGQTRAAGGASRRAVVAALVATGVLLVARGPAEAAGKLGGASQLDRSAYVTATDDEAGEDVDRPTKYSGKLGVGTGEGD